jgi:hypothetical protein
MKGVNSTFPDQKGAFFQSRMKSAAFGRKTPKRKMHQCCEHRHKNPASSPVWELDKRLTDLFDHVSGQ